MPRKIIVGLGNPGREFAGTYHNVGMLALQKMAGGLAFKPHKKRFAFAIKDAAVLVLPLTFMNESGIAVREATKKFGVAPEHLIVIHDESDLPVGKYKISDGRNSAGHKGVQSIMNALHAKNFTRIRIGIRPIRETTRKKASEFVLKKITPKDRRILDGVFEAIKGDLPQLL